MTSGLLLAASVAAIASAADCVTTAVALKRGLTEGNPVARWLFGRHVVLGSALVSAIVLVGSYVAVQAVPSASTGAQILFWVLAAAHSVAAAVNVRSL